MQRRNRGAKCNCQSLCRPKCNIGTEVFFFLHQPHRYAHMTENRPRRLGDDLCRLNGTVQAFSEQWKFNHLRRTIRRVPGRSHSPRPARRLIPPTLAVGPHPGGIPIRWREFSACYPRAAPGTWFGNPLLNRMEAHSERTVRPQRYTGRLTPAGRV